MPELGRPQATSPFRDVTMGPRRAESRSRVNSSSSDGSIGRELNRLSGSREEVNFVNPDEHNKLGKDGFLRLLTHQLSHQDPLKPMDQKQFAADLAQFSQLEQLANLNSHFEKMGGNKTVEDKFYGATFLGKKVETEGSGINYDGEAKSVLLPFYLPRHAQKITVKIFDDQRQMVAEFENGMTPRGNGQFPWDGKTFDGTKVAPGRYSFEILAHDEQYQQFRGQTKSSGIVTGVSFENGETLLTLDNHKRVLLRDVTSFKFPDMKGAEKTPDNNFARLKKNAASSYSNHQE